MMANAICRASGCNERVTRGRYTAHCERHHRNLYRHGDTHGNAFTKRELAHYRKQVKAKRKATKDAPFWSQVELRWVSVVNSAQSVISAYNAGRPTARPTRVAAETILKVASAAEAAEVIEVM